MTVATFNVNSIRARLPVLIQWLEARQPDVVALQETKVEDDKFPLADIEALGYRVAIHGQQKYNGVALLSKFALDDVHVGFEDDEWPIDCRIIRARVQGVQIINTYVPNGSAVGSEKYEYKLRWFENFGNLVRNNGSTQDSMIWMGDINVAPTDLDVFEPDKMRGSVCFSELEKQALERLKEFGWTDCFRKFTHEGGHFSYWEYFLPNGFKRNLGWRIDHVYASEALAGRCTSCIIDKEPRGWERPSDHTPVIAEFDLV